MKILLRLAAFVLPALPLAAAAAPPTLCKPGETAYFNCAVGKAHKLASLCGHAEAPRYLQYRFGLVGHAPELQVPATTDDPAMGSTFFYEGTRRADGREWGWDVWFHHADAIYVLNFFIDQDDAPDGMASIDYWIGRPEGAPRTMACASPAGGRAVENAVDLIRAMAPPQREWQLSPYDERILRDRSVAASAAKR